VERGDVLCAAAAGAGAARRLTARIFWLHDAPLAVGDEVLVRISAAQVRGAIARIRDAVDPGATDAATSSVVAQNNVADVEITLAGPIGADVYTANPRTGRVVIGHADRIAGGGLVLALDSAGAAPTAEPPEILERRAADLAGDLAPLAPAERLARFRAA